MIWERDKGEELNRPCVHRVNKNGHYSKGNIEVKEFTIHVREHSPTRSKGFKHSEETKEKIRQALKGNCNGSRKGL